MKVRKIAFLSTILLVFMITLISSTSRATSLFSEPQSRPASIPDTAVFNKDTGEYYDPSFVEWDSTKQKYEVIANKKHIEVDMTNIKLGNPVDESLYNDFWREPSEKMKSSDEVEEALYEYAEAMSNYNKNHPGIMASSRWEVGQEGPLNIIVSLGVKNLPKLINHIQVGDHFTVPIMIAIEKMTNSTISNIDPSDEGIRKWKRNFMEKLMGAKLKVKVISEKLDSGTASDKEIKSELSNLGMFALPAMYDEIVNNSNAKLAKYTGCILSADAETELDLDAAQKVLTKYQDEFQYFNDLTKLNQE